MELYDENVSHTVENFLGYVRDRFYDNTLFHRVVADFIVQGGGFEPGMVQKPTRWPIHNEARQALPNRRGTIAMARLPHDPHSAAAQFFINTRDNAGLDHLNETPAGWGYCVFGEVIDGMGVVDQIEAVARTTRGKHHHVPTHDVVIRTVESIDADQPSSASDSTSARHASTKKPTGKQKPAARAVGPNENSAATRYENLPSVLDMADPAPEWLHAATPDEFLPSRTRWSKFGGFVLLLAFTGLVVLSGVLRYRVTVEAHATVRPTGELRIVEAGADGVVRRILVTQNQQVAEGDVVAYVDDSRLQTKKTQLEGAIVKGIEQLEQLDAQFTALDRQVEAEREFLARSLSAAESVLSLARRQHRETTEATAAEEQEAEALRDFARDELSRYRVAASEGVVSELELKQREANLKSAEARLAQVRAALNPSKDEINIAREKILQTRASGEAAMAKFSKERQGLLDRRVQVQTELADHREELAQVDIEIDRTAIRAPVPGIVQVLTLRNPGQVVAEGELVARIAPLDSAMQLKAMVARRDVGKVEVGQSVHVRISACPYPDYGTLRGVVVAVSPDVIAPEQQTHSASLEMSHDALTGYEVTVRPESNMLTHAGQQCFIQPGMVGQAEILSRKETILQFFLRKARLVTDV